MKNENIEDPQKYISENLKAIVDIGDKQFYTYVKTAISIDHFALQMKARMLKKTLEGRGGYENGIDTLIEIPVEEIKRRFERLISEENILGSVSIGIANWAFIDWYTKNKTIIDINVNESLKYWWQSEREKDLFMQSIKEMGNIFLKELDEEFPDEPTKTETN